MVNLGVSVPDLEALNSALPGCLLRERGGWGMGGGVGCILRGRTAYGLASIYCAEAGTCKGMGHCPKI